MKFKLANGSAIILVILASAVFVNMLGNEFVYDDYQVAAEREAIRTLRSIPALVGGDYFEVFQQRTYCPMVTLAYILEHKLFGGGATGFHIGSLLYHIACSACVFFLLMLLLDNRAAALFGSLVFVVHPVHTEAVSWISGRTDLMSGTFFFLSLLLYIKSVKKRSTGLYIASLAVFVLALFSKEMAITLPVIIILYDYMFVQEGKATARLKQLLKGWARYAPYFLAGFFLVLVRFVLFNQEVSAGSGYPPGGLYSILITFSKVLMIYVRLLFYPVNLVIDYHILVSTSILDRGIIPSIIAVAALLYALIRVHRYSREIAFAGLYFLVTLIPVSNILPFGILIAERYMYIPSLGLSLLAGVLYMKLINLNESRRKTVIALLAAVLVFYAAGTLKRNTELHDGISMWSAAVDRFPGNSRAHNNLGSAYARAGQYEKAIPVYKRAQQLQPGDAKSHANLALSYEKAGMYNEAFREYELVKKIDPGYKIKESSIGSLYYKAGMYGNAVEMYLDAIEANPGNPDNYFNLAVTYGKTGDLDSAVRNYEKAIEINPGYVEACNNLGIIYGKRGRQGLARAMYKKAIEAKPGYFDARYNLAMSYSGNDFNAMLAELIKAAEIDPDYPELYYNLGIAYDRVGNTDKAIAAYEKEVEFNPGHASTHKNAGILYYKLGKNDKAVYHWKKYLELNPGATDAGLIRQEISRLEK